MKIIYIITLWLSIWGSPYIWAQAPKPLVPNTATVALQLSAADSVFLLVEGEQKYVQHLVKPNQTLYAIANFYAVELSDLYYCNPTLAEKGIRVGSRLKIPIAGRALRRQKGQGFVDSLYAKVYYKVKPSETFYRLSSVYFKMPIETIQKMNKLPADAVLKTGQVLHIAWLSKHGVPDSLRRYNGLTGVLLEKNVEQREKYETAKATKKEWLNQGAAYWLKGEHFSDNTSLSVMYDGQPIGAVIRLENPMTGRVVYAKVIGSVPQNADINEAIVVVSPTVAYALGALDARFYVKVNYLK